MITTLANNLTSAFNRSQTGSLTAMLESVAFGTVLRQKLPATVRNAVPALDPYGASGNVSLFLPDDAKATLAISGYARAGTGTVGPLSAQPAGSTLTAGQFMPSLDGNLIFYAADAWTLVDVVYLPEAQDAVEVILPVASGVVILPPGTISPYGFTGGAVDLMEVQRADSSTAKLQITAPAATNSSTGTACFNLAKTRVLLDSADGATSVRIKLGIVSQYDLNALLEAVSTFI